MLLTILWGSCLIVGKCDLENSVAIDQKDTKGLNLAGKSLCLNLSVILDDAMLTIVNVAFII